MLTKEDWVLIGKYLTDLKKDKNREYLFQIKVDNKDKKGDKQFSKSGYRRYISRTCKNLGLIELTPNDFRKIDSTKRWENMQNTKDLEISVKIQGHSITQDLKTYRKEDKKKFKF